MGWCGVGRRVVGPLGETVPQSGRKWCDGQGEGSARLRSRAQALRAGSQGYSWPPFTSDLLKSSLRVREKPSLCGDGQGYIWPCIQTP